MNTPSQSQSAGTLMVMAGGTGGHIFPALAVAEAVRAHGWRVVWMGNPNGMEARLVPQHGIEMVWVNFGALRGKGLVRMLLLPFNLLRACYRAWRAIGQVKPDVVIGAGGYVTVPGGLMASLKNCPLIVHEQNSIAGLSNRLLARLADRVLTGFPDAIEGGEWVGNPVRDEIVALPEPATRYGARSGPLKIVVVGGSLGAHALNVCVPVAAGLMDSTVRPKITHQSGKGRLADLRERYEAAGVTNVECVEFIDDMAALYAGADLLICRSGALTVAELAAAGVASLLVPFPQAVDDHQTHNASFLVEAGAAWLMPQSTLTPEILAGHLQGLTREKLATMARAARALAKPDATARVAQACIDASNRGSKK